jgi:hypothetical protein
MPVVQIAHRRHEADALALGQPSEACCCMAAADAIIGILIIKKVIRHAGSIFFSRKHDAKF